MVVITGFRVAPHRFRGRHCFGSKGALYLCPFHLISSALLMYFGLLLARAPWLAFLFFVSFLFVVLISARCWVVTNWVGMQEKLGERVRRGGPPHLGFAFMCVQT